MPREYFSERIGETPKKISVEHLREIVRIQYNKFNKDGYFQHQFGYDCLERGYVPGRAGISERDQLIVTFGGRGDFLVPTLVNFKQMDLFSLFDLIEFLYDHIAKPIDPFHHTWDNCGLHVNGDANYDLGKHEWRYEMNMHLPNLETGHTLTKDGNIEELPSSEGLTKLTQNPTIHNVANTIDDRVKHACNLFLKGNSDINDKRDALKNLADVLELLRKDLQSYIPNDEENRLFEIANTFGIRHHKDTQKTDYNQGVYYYWIFYSYLATIDLLGRLKKESSD